MAAGSVAGNKMTQYGQMAEARRSWKTSAMGEDLRMYRMSFPSKGGQQSCLVEGFPGRATTRTAIQVHFLHRHILDTVVSLEEGNLPHPRCPRCDMLVSWQALNGRHPAAAHCARGAEQKRQWLAEVDLRDILERAFEVYREPLENVTAFKYLGRLFTAGDDDCLAVLGNLDKARNSWGRLSQILSQEGADLKVSGHFFKAVS